MKIHWIVKFVPAIYAVGLLYSTSLGLIFGVSWAEIIHAWYTSVPGGIAGGLAGGWALARFQRWRRDRK